MRLVHRIERWVDPAAAFAALYRDSADAFWLDSSRPGGEARFSFMGDAAGPLGATVAYDVEAGEVTVRRGSEAEVRSESVLDYLDQELARLRPAAVSDLPFDFQCGFAGYLGYEVKADCGSPSTHRSPHPDAAFVFADRLLAFDHRLQQTHLLCLCDHETEEAANAWIAKTAARLVAREAATAQGSTGEGSAAPTRCCSADPYPVVPHLHRSRSQ